MESTLDVGTELLNIWLSFRELLTSLDLASGIVLVRTNLHG